MYQWKNEFCGVTVWDSDHPKKEVFLQGDEAANFKRTIHRAAQKEHSSRCNPQKLPIQQNVLAEYF